MTMPADTDTLHLSTSAGGRWAWPGPLVVRLVAVAVLALVLASSLAAWLVTRATAHEALNRVVRQQTDEVEMVAGLLASKIEQSQKLLRSVAASIPLSSLESPASLEWLLRDGLPAVQFFDSIQVASATGQLSLNLRAGRLRPAVELDAAERDALRRTLSDGKPQVSELIGGGSTEARIIFTMPLRGSDDQLAGVVAGSLRVQSQALLPASMALPARDASRLVVFTREGTVLSHSDPERVLGLVRDEPGLNAVYARWLDQQLPLEVRGRTEVVVGHVVSLAGMPLPQWMVARITPSHALLAPLQGAQQKAWWLAAVSMLLCAALLAALMLYLSQPLARVAARAQRLVRAAEMGTEFAPSLPGAAGLLPEGDSLRAPSVRPLAAWGEASELGDDHGDSVWPSSGTEITQLVQAFERLQQTAQSQSDELVRVNAQRQAILDHATMGIVIAHGGSIALAGQHAAVLLGYSAREMAGLPARALYANEADYQRMLVRLQNVFATHGRFDGDVCMVRKDGSPVWVRLQGHAVQANDKRQGTLWMLEDITALRADEGQPRWERSHDALTRLPNALAFDERLGVLLAEHAQAALQRSHHAAAADAHASAPPAQGDAQVVPGVMLYIDIDHFTLINDLAGHDAGDDVLRHVARLLESQLRQVGWVARLGGDEFAVLLAACTVGRARALAEQLRAAVEFWQPTYQGRSFTLGVSIGLVVLDTAGQGVSAVRSTADMACYDAKRAGRNRVETRYLSAATVLAGLA